jgi:GNAT superfamily N-acetyltransferase
LDLTVRLVDGPTIRSRGDEIVAVYGAVFSAPPYEESPAAIYEFGHRLPHHTEHEGFRGAVAEDAGRVVGFAYGFSSREGQWWHDVVARGLGPDLASPWLSDAFELSDLALLPAYRGQGFGGALHDIVIDGLPHLTAVASTASGDDPAATLYRRRGWVILRREFRFPGVAPVFDLIGLDLHRRYTSSTSHARST